MSYSDRHAIIPFVAGTSRPSSGQVLIKVGSRQTAAMTKAGKTAKGAICASVPTIHHEEILSHVEELIPQLESAILEARKGILEEHRADGVVTTEDMSLPAVITWFRAQDRLTEEFCREWITSHEDVFAAFCAEQFRWTEDILTEGQLQQVRKVQNGWTDVLVKYAAAKKGAYMQHKLRKGFRALIAFDPGSFEDAETARIVRFLDDCDRQDADVPTGTELGMSFD